jgi:hypothetical protein
MSLLPPRDCRFCHICFPVANHSFAELEAGESTADISEKGDLGRILASAYGWRCSALTAGGLFNVDFPFHAYVSVDICRLKIIRHRYKLTPDSYNLKPLPGGAYVD